MSEEKCDLISVLVGLVRNNKAGSEIVALAAEAIAANARFNHRVGRSKHDESVTDDDFLEFLDLSDVLVRRCRSAATAFETDGDHEKLCEVLLDIRRQLDAAAR